MKPWLKIVLIAPFAVLAALYLVPPAKHLAERFYAPWASTAALEKVLLSPKVVTLVPAQALQYSVAGKFNDGSTLPIAVDFAATGGTVTAGGVYKAGNTTGTFRVIAQASGGALTDTATVTITPLSTDPDAVKLMNQLPATGSATVLIDGPRPSSCANDDIFLGTGTITVGSLLAPSGPCPAEVAVFSQGNAMRLETQVSSWTNNGGDVRTEALTPPIRVPLIIWVDTVAVIGTTAPLQDLVNTNTLFFDQQVGVDFDTSPTVVRDRTTDPMAKATIGYGCDSAPGVRTSAYYVEGALNVYYVHDIHSATDAIGWNCVDRGFPNQVYVSMTGRSSSTLAHEIGHALGLQLPFDGHVGGFVDAATQTAYNVKGFDTSNLMWSYGTTRDKITMGQAYRMSADRLSWLNLPPSHRPGQPVKDCGCNPFHEDVCPMLARVAPGALTPGFTNMMHPLFGCSIVMCRVTATGTPPPDCSGGGVSVLTPGSAFPLPVGSETFLRSSVLDTVGAGQPTLSAYWSSANPGIAFVRFDGLVHGQASGCAVVNAWVGGARAAIKVDVGGSGAC